MNWVELCYAAAGQAGFLQPCTWHPADGRPSVTASVGVAVADTTVLDQLARSTDTTMRFPSTALVGLARGDVVDLAGVSYQVRDIRAVGDGSEQVATLTRR